MMFVGVLQERRRRLVVGVGVVVAALGLAGVVDTTRHKRGGPQEVSVHELTARKLAIKSVRPQFPAESLKRGAQGVVIVEFVFSVEGRVLKARAVEGPDAACREAAVHAVHRWKFKPLNGPNGRPAEVSSKLTFYFDIHPGGQGVVSNGGSVEARKSGTGRFGGSIDPDGVARLAAEGGLRIVDIRPREASRQNQVAEAVLIPAEEIQARAREFEGAKSVVVICYPTFESFCDIAARQIVRYTDVRQVFVRPSSPQ